MASVTNICLVFKTGLPTGTFKLQSDTLKAALYTSSATNGVSTTAYSPTNEISGTGYSAGGNPVTGYTAGSGANTGGVQTGYTSFSNVSWTTATFGAASMLLYDVTVGANGAIFVYDFGGTFTVSAGTFTIIFPTADPNNAILRIS